MQKNSFALIKSILFILSIGSLLFAESKPLVIGYYPSWNKYTYTSSDIPFEYLTNICHAFIFPYENGELDLNGFTENPELIQACHENEVKISISVGGWDPERTPRFTAMVIDSIARHRFVENLTQFCLNYSYDGADIDWEYPPPDKQIYTSLLFQELHDAFSAVNPPLLLSIAAPSTDINNRYDWSVLNQVLDWIGVMTYDYYGSWTSKAGPNSPLYGNESTTDQGWIDHSVKHYLYDKGVLAEKLCIGIPFYGWEFKASTLFGPSTSAQQRPYKEIYPLLQAGWTRHWDETTHTPWLSNPDLTKIITYDDETSITEKCSYILNYGLAGTIIWALGQDYIGQSTPLLTVVGTELDSYIQTVNEAEIPVTTELLPVYPNPFNAITSICFSLKNPTYVKLNVYNVQGQLIKALSHDDFMPGVYKVTFQGFDISSGLYFCTLETDWGIYTQKMVLLK
ncbi:MAG: glycosyl hydrolase family 18 protein [Candidatus Marinimicrobia bacterium]|nr:glycosyl hydrolase family 18 protein [Candidatus Neomarinimicrobiota bacterium]MDD5581754.1 glycosyl hydrolase family 18 protein [Candidatus Neomarinimicrobiota bacterium]